MSNIEESATWDDGVYQLEVTDPVQGGTDGVDNLPHKALANRTRWLKTQLEQIESGALVVGSSNKLKTARKINGIYFNGESDIEISLTGYIARPTKLSPTSISVAGTTLTLSSPVAGTDYYFTKTAIQTVKDAYTIGGFHYGLVPIDEAPTGNKTEADMVAIRGIWAASIWTNWSRPVAPNPEAMCLASNNKWVDIYPMDSEYGIRKYSKAHTTIAGGTTEYGRAIPKIPLEFGGDGTITYGKFTWFQACEVAASAGKEMISYSEYPTYAYGVIEGTDCSSLEDVQGRVEHYASLTSKYMEQATGTQYAWGKDLIGDTAGTFAWKDNADSRGQIYSIGNSPNAVVLGGYRDNGVNAGSRYSIWNYYVWASSWPFGSRFACDHLELV